MPASTSSPSRRATRRDITSGSDDTGNYTGDCEVGGPAAERELPGLRVRKFAVGATNNNVYVLRCTATGKSLIVDAPAPTARVVEEARDGDPVAIVITHGHHDHVAGLRELRRALGVPIWCHADDAPLLPVPADRTLVEETIAFGNVTVRVLHLPGHTDGGLALLYDAGDALGASPHLFIGDSLFPGGPGATGRDAQRFGQLMDSLEGKVFGRLPDATWVYPGHGRDTTLGAERPHLAEWRARGW